MIVHVSERRGDGADPLGAAARPQGVRRDLPAVPGADREGPRRASTWRAPSTSAARRRATRRARRPCWLGLETGVFQIFSSDHCPFRYDEPAGQAHPEGPHQLPLGAERHSRRRDAAADPVLGGRGEGAHHARAVRGADRRPTTPRCTACTRSKGTIAVGADADIAIWDPERKVTIAQSLLHHGSDYTPYEGLRGDGLAGDDHRARQDRRARRHARRRSAHGRARRPRALTVCGAGRRNLISLRTGPSARP